MAVEKRRAFSAAASDVLQRTKARVDALLSIIPEETLDQFLTARRSVSLRAAPRLYLTRCCPVDACSRQPPTRYTRRAVMRSPTRACMQTSASLKSRDSLSHAYPTIDEAVRLAESLPAEVTVPLRTSGLAFAAPPGRRGPTKRGKLPQLNESANRWRIYTRDELPRQKIFLSTGDCSESGLITRV